MLGVSSQTSKSLHGDDDRAHWSGLQINIYELNQYNNIGLCQVTGIIKP